MRVSGRQWDAFLSSFHRVKINVTRKELLIFLWLSAGFKCHKRNEMRRLEGSVVKVGNVFITFISLCFHTLRLLTFPSLPAPFFTFLF